MTRIRKAHDFSLTGAGRRRRMILLACALAAPAGQLPAQSGDVRVHDPVIIRQDSLYYIFSTGVGISVKRSSDLCHWENSGRVFEAPPAWALQAVPGFTGHIWAPDIFQANGQYYLFYSVSAFGKNTSCIGVAVNKTLHPGAPEFQWIDHGVVLESMPNRDAWNAIDPNVVRDRNGDCWMDFGSFWSGIKLVKLDPSLLRIQTQPQAWYPLAGRPRSPGIPDAEAGDGAIEAPFVVLREGWFYLFVSFDYCCRGVNSTYKIMVGRAKEITGPYLDRAGRPMLEGGATLLLGGDEHWPGVGHCAVFSDRGAEWLVYHAYDASKGGQSILRIRKLEWDAEGWPVAAESLCSEE